MPANNQRTKDFKSINNSLNRIKWDHYSEQVANSSNDPDMSTDFADVLAHLGQNGSYQFRWDTTWYDQKCPSVMAGLSKLGLIDTAPIGYNNFNTASSKCNLTPFGAGYVHYAMPKYYDNSKQKDIAKRHKKLTKNKKKQSSHWTIIIAILSIIFFAEVAYMIFSLKTGEGNPILMLIPSLIEVVFCVHISGSDDANDGDSDDDSDDPFGYGDGFSSSVSSYVLEEQGNTTKKEFVSYYDNNNGWGHIPQIDYDYTKAMIDKNMFE